ncbi:cyclic nucleotide-binding domain-containing protein [Caenimonas sedimenti]|uniref:Cyclic nucleotide-binding domain-containing protein n=1 Tax=Caenimonas sedimenti TaxID=2596921 RepID=A0A562ZQI9_9BURK|nr:cyclic nucleotide-binding domain-containing protein [Caenimonas sedimenti]TWO70657.1 cyclic nucleotide-binding domain-containing protein [Caenimonas sedimenti]
MDLLTLFASSAQAMASPRGAAIGLASLLGLGLVFLGTFARTMVRLRALTACSNVFLLVAALLMPNLVAVLLYVVLLPLNVWRLREIFWLTRKVEHAARTGDLSGLWLKPYMRIERHPGGHMLFQKGDAAQTLYLPVEGQLELVEIGKPVPLHELLGEVSFFAADRRRTLSARCLTSCVVLGIGETDFRQLYFQNPQFAFLVTNLIAQRLGADIQRLQAHVSEMEVCGRG